MIYVKNNGADIIASNYWTSTAEACGLFFLSVNAGEARLLVPRNAHHYLNDLTASVKHVVLSFGPSNSGGAEWLAEDGTDTPFFIQLCSALMDQKVQVRPGMVQQATASIWIGSNHGPLMHRRTTAYIRNVDILPCLQPVALTAGNLLTKGSK